MPKAASCLASDDDDEVLALFEGDATRSVLSLDPKAPEVVPRYVGDVDRPWLRELLDTYEGAVRARVGELDDRVRGLRPRLTVRGATVDEAIRVLNRLYGSRVAAARKPSSVRRALFLASARTTPEAWKEAAALFEVDVEVLEESLFADLPSERRVEAPAKALTLDELIARINLGTVQGLLRRARHLELRLRGNARDVLRYVHLSGLLGVVRKDEADGFVTEVSGPFAIFRRTNVYARALAGLVPRLMWCERFELRANCHFDHKPCTLRVSTGAPIFPAEEPKRFDSQVECRFYRDFLKATDEWVLVREPSPVVAGASVFFPDFEIRPAHGGADSWILEIVGFWTNDYLRRKLAHVRDARLARLILCVDEERHADRLKWPGHARVVPYRRRVPVREVLRVLSGDRGVSSHREGV